jgi:DNA-binding MarR family transcriptional regulator/GNAT superfamily N-acetyltransferase
MESALIEQVRSFNRIVTERIGVLNDHYLGRGHSLGEARLLWEIGNEGAEVRELRSRLALDSAYVSRLLRALERQGLVVVEPSVDDRRVRLAHLTAAGQAERAELDRLSDGFAASLLETLSANQQTRLAEAMAEVERLLIASSVRIVVADPSSADARWCLEQYFSELNQRFEAGFDPARGIPALAHELTPPAGLFLVAYLRQRPVGCGALKFHADAPAYLKRMWVAPEVRGLGLGRRFLRELERHARESGATTVQLETNRTLTEAIALYRSAGYQEVAPFNDESYAHHWFEKRL